MELYSSTGIGSIGLDGLCQHNFEVAERLENYTLHKK